jgi:hypothetical protein
MDSNLSITNGGVWWRGWGEGEREREREKEMDRYANKIGRK